MKDHTSTNILTQNSRFEENYRSEDRKAEKTEYSMLNMVSHENALSFV